MILRNCILSVCLCAIGGCSLCASRSEFGVDGQRTPLATPFVQFVRSGGIAGGISESVTVTSDSKVASSYAWPAAQQAVFLLSPDRIRALIETLKSEGIFRVCFRENVNMHDDIRLEFVADAGDGRVVAVLYKSTATSLDQQRFQDAIQQIRAIAKGEGRTLTEMPR